MISPASIDDAAAAAALLDVALEDRLSTAAGLRYRMATAQPEDRGRYWKAESDGELVGWAYAGLDAFAADTGRAFANIVVHPEHRRRGFGSDLWAVVSAHLDEIGATRTLTFSGADDDSKCFALKHGFRLESTEITSAVDPRTLPPPSAPPAGIELYPLSAFADDPEQVYQADRDSMQDEPGPFDLSGLTLAIWRRIIWDHPECDGDLGAAAVADGVVVGTTFLYADRDTGRAMNGGTGVVGAYRGRGLGLLVKQHSLGWAAAAGITRVITQNDDTNAPMLAINARLGYEPFSVGHAWIREP
jgi:GNAT superfamily N-acetyltransferase